MIIYQKDGVTVQGFLDTRRKLQSGLYRVRIRVIYRTKTIYEHSTGKELSEDDWKNLHESKKKGMKEIRKDIQSSFSLIKEAVQDLTETGSFSPEALKMRFKVSANTTVNQSFKNKIAELKEEDREGTRLYYDNVLKGIERYKGENIQFSSITVDWLKGYEKFLRTEKENKSYTTIGMHMRAIRAIINQAKKVGIIKEINYPFGQGRYEIPTGEGRKMALLVKQIGDVVQCSDGFPKTDIYRDLWFFSYLCNGINVFDLCKLKYSDIENDEIAWYRTKTIHTQKNKKKIRAFITPEMQKIINQWGNEKKPENFIFPFLKGGEDTVRTKAVVNDITRRINRKMKNIAEKLGISKISTYTARHSFATVLKRSGANISYISESLGHADLKTTENYLDSFETETRKQNSEYLTKFN